MYTLPLSSACEHFSRRGYMYVFEVHPPRAVIFQLHIHSKSPRVGVDHLHRMSANFSCRNLNDFLSCQKKLGGSWSSSFVGRTLSSTLLEDLCTNFSVLERKVKMRALVSLLPSIARRNRNLIPFYGSSCPSPWRRVRQVKLISGWR